MSISSGVVSNPNSSASEVAVAVDDVTVVALFLSLLSGGMVSIPRACARESAADLAATVPEEALSFWLAADGVAVVSVCLVMLYLVRLGGTGGGEEDLVGEEGVGEGVGVCV